MKTLIKISVILEIMLAFVGVSFAHDVISGPSDIAHPGLHHKHVTIKAPTAGDLPTTWFGPFDVSDCYYSPAPTSSTEPDTASYHINLHAGWKKTVGDTCSVVVTAYLTDLPVCPDLNATLTDGGKGTVIGSGVYGDSIAAAAWRSGFSTTLSATSDAISKTIEGSIAAAIDTVFAPYLWCKFDADTLASQTDSSDTYSIPIDYWFWYNCAKP